jgi:transcriptional regulator GlxA family with amidase domain
MLPTGGVARCMLSARGPAERPAGHSLSEWPDSTRNHLPNPARTGGARLRAIATLGDQSHRTAKAIAWVRANYAKPLRVEDLAKIAGMGVSTLHHHFRTLTAMSPLQYQKQLRLHAARERMLIDSLDAASAAFEVGYESATQFNREYSRFFGQPPKRDIRTLRSPGALPLESVSNQ